MTTCVCKDCGKQRTRHWLGLCVACFKARFGFRDSERGVKDWDWDVEDAA